MKNSSKNFLKEIIEKKENEVRELKKLIPEKDIIRLASKAKERRGFLKTLSIYNNKPNIIAEIKLASPSKGDINLKLDIKKQARAYEKAGASAISVLTEKDFFKGHPDYIRQIKKVTKLPVLRKDFIISKYQLYESVLLGADAVLLIVSVLSQKKLSEYIKICKKLNLDVLVEIHNEAELKRATRAHAEFKALITGI